MKKTVEISVMSLGSQGDGIAEHDGQTVYIPYGLPGDHLKVTIHQKKRGGPLNGEILEVLKPSENRVPPTCQHFSRCGGCRLQHISESGYKSWINDRVTTALNQHQLSCDNVMTPQITPKESRRRIAVKARRVAQGVVLGFNQSASHTIIDAQECPVTRPELTRLFTPLRRVLGDVLEQGMMGDIHLTLTATGVDVVCDFPKSINLSDRENLVSFAETHDVAALHWRDQGFLDPVIVRREPMVKFGSKLVRFPPAAFLQASEEGEAMLVARVSELVDKIKPKRVLDLFCGLGTFTFPVSEHCQVSAYEGVKNIVDSMKEAVSAQSLQHRISVFHRDLFRSPLQSNELDGFDAVILNPPRTGAKSQIEELSISSITKCIYVSCNPNTFARDAKIVQDAGFSLVSLAPVDQFLWSAHLETINLFIR